MNPSISTWSAHRLLETGKLTAEQFFDMAANHRIKMVEIVDIDFPQRDLAAMEKLSKLAANRGLGISCMSLEHDLCRLTAEERKADVEKVKTWMGISKSLGIRNVRAFTGWHKPNVPYPMQMDWVYQGLSLIAEEAEKLDLDIVLENHNDVCLDADEILSLFKRINSKHLFTCPDIFNYKLMKDETTPIIEEWSFTGIGKLLPLARNAHIKVCEPIEGNTNDRYVDLNAVFRQMKEAGYNGPAALEFLWPYLSKDKDEVAELGKAMEVLVYHVNKYVGDGS